MDVIAVNLETPNLIWVLLLGLLGFLVSMLITPLYTTAAYKWQWWKKPRPKHTAAQSTSESARRQVPTMAGIVFVIAVCLITLSFNWSRTETWLPLAAFAGAASVGLLDDIMDIINVRRGGKRLSSKLRLLLITLVALIGGWFFYNKLDVSSIFIPVTGGEWQIGWFIVPLFILVVVATANAVNISDGLDGLAGGLATTAFAAYAFIAFLQGRLGVAGFCMTVVGVLLTYTWFNIAPARFFMGDVGSFALGTALGVVALITDTVLLLPLIGIVFMAEGGAVLLQGSSRMLRGGKTILRDAPLHRHFEAIGWPDTKVTMRFWVIGQVAAVLGLLAFLLGEYL